MMKLSTAAKALYARHLGNDVTFTAVSTDTRTIATGDLFIALRGDNFDGAAFVATAVAAGAAAVMVNVDSQAQCAAQLPENFPVLLVDDTRLALGDLAAYWRKQFNVPVVALTGSNGKTTVKEMIASILRVAAGGDEAVLATKGNLNNDIGMPITLLRLNAQHRYVVLEMGMNHAGEIEYLTHIAQPDVALVNNASGAHLEGLGSVEGVAQAKGEIFSGLKDHGKAVINADDAHAPLWRSLVGTHDWLEFGSQETADICGSWCSQENGMALQVQTPTGDFNVTLHAMGAHNARNALAATAAAIALNVPLEMIAEGLEKFKGVSGRLQPKAGRGGALVIDDAYNANPASLHAAIDVLAALPGKRILVMGDMGELGEDAASFHAEIGQAAQVAGIDKLYALGELSKHAVLQFGAAATHFAQIEDLQQALDAELDTATTVLVKGSRFMKMERVVQHCLG